MSGIKKTHTKKHIGRPSAHEPGSVGGRIAGWKRPRALFAAISLQLRSAHARRTFLVTGMVVLGITTLFWTILSARLQEANADQFIDAYMFEDLGTFTAALFPGAHTFLMKWPLFAIMPFFGHGRSVFMVMTILMVVATVASLVYILFRIERRPLLLGLLCLGLASVLMLVPAQPYPGALLPANFAMTTTRNLEYILFIWCLYRLLRLQRFRSAYFGLTTVLLAILIASDKLFGVLALGSLLAIAAVASGNRLFRRKPMDIRTYMLQGAAVAAGIILANLLLFAISRSGLTGIVNEADASPFKFITSLKQFAEGLLYAAMAVFTNFGANPVHGVSIVRDLPGALLQKFQEITIVAYLVNAVLLSFSLYAAYKVATSQRTDAATRLTKLLLGATAVSLAVFVLTDHYYPVDSRYITISFFALVVAAATYLRHNPVRREIIAASTVILLLALPLGMLQASREYGAGQAAMADDISYYAKVAQILDAKNIKRLLGDYWKIVPIKARMKKEVVVSPVNTCRDTDARAVLLSKKWFAVPKRTPTSYFAVQEPQKITYQDCSLARLATVYGTPSERVALQEDPKAPYLPAVLLLLYGQGINPLNQVETPSLPEPPKNPQPLQPLSAQADCSKGTTLSVVAHEDDDLLFLNPDIYGDIQGGRCMRTVYVTAGDAGETYGYWNSREKGAKSAYAHMYNVPDEWQDERRQVGDRTISVARLKDAPQVALVFLRLPDGNRDGEGFGSNTGESLRKLFDGRISSMRTMDDTMYTKEQLVELLHGIMAIDLPDYIRTQSQDDAPEDDHPDHMAVGMVTRLAAERYRTPHTVSAYRGYSSWLYEPNLSDEQIAIKQDIFLAYAKYDGAVCQTAEECGLTFTYGNYLTRQYKTEETAGPVSGQ